MNILPTVVPVRRSLARNELRTAVCNCMTEAIYIEHVSHRSCMTQSCLAHDVIQMSTLLYSHTSAYASLSYDR